MKAQYSLFSFVCIGFLVFNVSACTQENQADAEGTSTSEVVFECGTDERSGKTVPATIVKNPDKDEPLTVIYFDPQNNYFGDKWTPETRCEEVSKRFQAIFDRDSLKYITADEAQWVTDKTMNVICSVKEEDARCEEEDLLFTLETDDDPNEVLGELMAFRNDPSQNKALTRGAKQPETFEEGKRVYYDFTSVLGETAPKEASQEKSAF
jgi:hypothetical protein